MIRQAWTASDDDRERCDACDRRARCAVWTWGESHTVRFAFCGRCVRDAARALGHRFVRRRGVSRCAACGVAERPTNVDGPCLGRRPTVLKHEAKPAVRVKRGRR